MLAPRYFSLLLAMVLALFVSLIAYFSSLKDVDFELYDYAHHLNSYHVAEDVLIIEIDEQSIQELGAWPWSRSVHGRLLEQLTRVGIDHVAFDVIFSEQNTSDIEGDIAFSKAIVEHGGVVLPTFIGQLKDKGAVLEIPPAPLFYEANPAIGHVHIDCNRDSICRSVFLKEGVGQPYWPHISLALLEMQMQQQKQYPQPLPGARPQKVDNYSSKLIYRDYHNFILFPEPGQFYQTVSYLDIINGYFPAGHFDGVTAFVGSTVAGLGDEISTPTGLLPGVVANATIFQLLREDALIYKVPTWLNATITGIIGFIILVFLARLTPLYFLIGTIIALGICYLTMCLVLIHWRLWFPVAPLMLLLIIYYPLWGWFKTQLALNFLKKQLKKLNVESIGDGAILALFEKENEVGKKDHSLGVEVVTNTLRQLNNLTGTVEEQRFIVRNTLDKLQEAVILAEQNGEIRLANQMAKNVFKLLPNSNLKDLGNQVKLQVNQSQEQWFEYMARLLEEPDDCEIELRLLAEGEYDNDTILYCRFAVTEFTRPKDEKTKMFILTFTNITALKSTERSKMDTLNFLSHDLRAPMVSILALIANIKTGRNTDSSEANLERIQAYAEKNLSYSESILQLSRAEGISAGKFNFIDLHAVLDAAYYSVVDYAAANDINIKIEREDNDFWVLGDGDLLERAIQNLLTNAIKYSFSRNDIILRICSEGANIQIKVIDYGVGINEKDSRLIFDRYKRGGAVHDQPGAGLGLYFIKTVMKKHSGTINIDSVVGEGSCFTLTLPRAHEV
ncbi:CHASE2 domain-containing protein [Agarilytica rhodophyticola]|uniref:CHASE2 domain-containing protein n=1 Tax=Agarilytica rhodophyticola TaxID=1737490 RepID=UPI000B344029|nr:CHASE2 domain-containing protein [Agarilytica rhodophyticola]